MSKGIEIISVRVFPGVMFFSGSLFTIFFASKSVLFAKTRAQGHRRCELVYLVENKRDCLLLCSG